MARVKNLFASVPGLPLASGDALPVVGLGTWKLDRGAASALVQAAIQTGYRHLDCACDYGNEAEVGAGIRAALAGGVCLSHLRVMRSRRNRHGSAQG